MDDAKSLRIAGWAGIVFSVLSVVVLPLAWPPPLPPALGGSGAQVAAWYGTHHTGFLVGNYLGVASFFPGIVQLVVIAARVRRLEAPNGWLGALVLSCGTFTYSVFACSLCVFQVLPFLIEPRHHAAAEAIGSLANIWFSLDGLAALPLVLAIGWATARTGAFPRWFGRLCWPVAVLAVVMSLGGLTATPVWLAGGGPATALGFVAFFGWTFALSILCFRLEPARK